MCLNCHIPLQNQQEYIVTGLVDGDVYRPVKRLNPDFDPELKLEGINCATCHVREGSIIGPTGHSEPGAHLARQDTTFLSQNLCVSCHNASAVVNPELVCTFETGDEWMNNNRSEGKTCIDCHMPEVTRATSSGGKVRASRFHNFPGSGISKWDSLEVEGLDGLSIESGNVRTNYQVGDSLKYELSLKNEFAGHRVPTGDPERFFLIKIELVDESGNIVMSVNERIGETWEWYPAAKKLADNNLNPGEERTYSLVTELIEQGNYKLITIVTKHRLDQASADYNKLTRQYPLFIDVYQNEIDIVVK